MECDSQPSIAWTWHGLGPWRPVLRGEREGVNQSPAVSAGTQTLPPAPERAPEPAPQPPLGLGTRRELASKAAPCGAIRVFQCGGVAAWGWGWGASPSIRCPGGLSFLESAPHRQEHPTVVVLATLSRPGGLVGACA